MLHMSAAVSATSGTDSEYDGISVAGAYTSTNSFSTPGGGFPSIVPSQQPIDPLHAAAVAAPTAVMGQAAHNVWAISETRGFASDGPIQNPNSPPIKVEPGENLTQMSIDTIVPNNNQTSAAAAATPVQIDYDELALDFVLT